MAIHLTTRDLEIMLALARSGFLSITQIKNKWFSDYSYCTRRLKQLKDHKFINVTYIERHGRGIYSLEKQGLELINDYYGFKYKSYSKTMKINHFISLGEFYINFTYEIEEYEIEYYLEELIPDIYVRYLTDKETDLLVEIDNTGKKKNIEGKINAYNEYLNSQRWRERFKLFPKCLIVTDYDYKKIKLNKMTKIPFIFISFNDLKEGKLRCLL